MGCRDVLDGLRISIGGPRLRWPVFVRMLASIKIMDSNAVGEALNSHTAGRCVCVASGPAFRGMRKVGDKAF